MLLFIVSSCHLTMFCRVISELSAPHNLLLLINEFIITKKKAKNICNHFFYMKFAFSLFILCRSFHICFALTLPLEQKTQIMPIIGRLLYTKYKHIKCDAFSIFFFSSNSSSSIQFFLSASIRMPFIWLVIFCLFSQKKINRRQKNRKRKKKQKQNKTLYRLCIYRLVICFIGSAIAHGALKAADIVLTYVFI